ncbi:MAG: nidogen-like domain-containing protein [Candidatus Cloacimonadaceae bacterium]|jgi:hypothetical protein|nr:hypothetical protein [Candidatus Cloacimonadota bacterium]MDX9950207.1 hypothetical protein [Candidatus Syntrophosphaera sp.]
MRKIALFSLFAVLIIAGTALLEAAVDPFLNAYDAWKQEQSYIPDQNPEEPHPSSTFLTIQNRDGECPLLIPYDTESFTLAMTPNDDGWLGPVDLPFTFSLYGQPYTQCWINNNGNITFDGGYYNYTPWGFPISGNPMVAPFFADVDTRGAGSVWYRIEPNNMVVIWDHVGYYSYGIDKLNTFELVISDGSYSPIGVGNNVAFSYADMSWTTGSASGGTDGFGGSPATVGINKGDGVLYAQIGRFDHAGYDYDGPYNNNDGVDWLDCKLFLFNTGGESANVAPVFTEVPSETVIELNQGESWSFTFTVISPEEEQITNAVVQHSLPSGMSYTVNPGNTCSIQMTINARASNGGSHTVKITATDDGTPNLSASYEFVVNISGGGAVEPISGGMSIFPNPFVGSQGANIGVELGADEIGWLTICNDRGQFLKRYYFGCNTNTVVYWDAKDLKGVPCASGVYLCQLEKRYINDRENHPAPIVKRMVLLK